jgi:putative ABC transport system permease protein
MGYAPGFYEISPCRILQGRYLNEVDISDKRKVCVIGKKVANDLYAPNEDVLGSIIRIGSIYWQVIGVYEDYSEDFSIFGSPNQMIYVPVSTLKQMRNMGDKINFMGFKAYDAVNMSELEPRILSFLKERKSVSPTDNEGVGSFSLKEMFDNFSMLFGGINTLIWIVGLGTLLAGMVGVSNIMLVTVRERTQEIGIRRALGATPMVIIKQIMSESVVLASISGFIGIAAGVGTLVLVQWFLETFPPEKIVLLNPQVSFITAVAAAIVLIVSGLLAGLLPSKRALQIKAIEALYDE